MQGINTYIPETNHVPSEYSVAAILSLLFMVSIPLVPALALLYFYVRTFRSMCAVPNMAVFCSSFTSWFPDMLLMYFLNDFEMVPLAPIITGITLVFTFHMHCISIVRYYYYYYYYYYYGPPLWSSGQSFWLQIQRSRVRFPALPDFLSSSGSGTGSTQPREVN